MRLYMDRYAMMLVGKEDKGSCVWYHLGPIMDTSYGSF